MKLRKWSLHTICPGLPGAAFPTEPFWTRNGARKAVRFYRALGAGRLFEYRLRNDTTGEEITL